MYFNVFIFMWETEFNVLFILSVNNASRNCITTVSATVLYLSVLRIIQNGNNNQSETNISVIWGFRLGVYEVFALLRCYAASDVSGPPIGAILGAQSSSRLLGPRYQSTLHIAERPIILACIFAAIQEIFCSYRDRVRGEAFGVFI